MARMLSNTRISTHIPFTMHYAVCTNRIGPSLIQLMHRALEILDNLYFS